MNYTMGTEGDLQDKLLNKIHIDDNGCWIWEGSRKGGRNDYGAACYKLKSWRAHRLSYEAFIGPIPSGLCVCHKCDVRLCINPEHLWLGTLKENTQDAVRKGRMSGNAGKKHN